MRKNAKLLLLVLRKKFLFFVSSFKIYCKMNKLFKKSERLFKLSKVAESILNLMFQFGMTQADLSERTGIAQPALHRLLSEKNTNPKLQTLQPLAAYFEVTMSQLLGEVELPKIEIKLEKTSYVKTLINLPLFSWQETSEITSYRRLKILQQRCKKTYPIDKKLANAAFITTMPADNNDLHFAKLAKNVSLVVSPKLSYRPQQMLLVNDRFERKLKIRRIVEYKNSEHAVVTLPIGTHRAEVLKHGDYIIGKIVRLIVDN